MNIILLVLAFTAGLLLPSPVQDIAKATFSTVWAWIKGLFTKVDDTDTK
jgi:hypothetical protein